ncbi:hydroxylysine kinase [Nephila pilipes]|uniref:Hydroxylysine kinase n=1 Tax=Nephila pilipes TaxID=299642 RepID=A0A8X6TZM8_NEPPI|nr:hydroxylysine kinase [Nephila pilipes]
MDLDEILKPNVSEALAIDLVRIIYGLEVIDIKSMISFNDQNFQIQVSEKHQNPYINNIPEDGYTLKILNTIKSSLDGHIDSMHSALNHLSRKGLRVPVPVQNLEGNTWKLETVPLLNEDRKQCERSKCAIHLITFLPGIPLNTLEITHDVLFQWGSLLAEFHNATEDMICQILKNKPIFYNLEHVLDTKRYMTGLPDEHYKLVDDILNKYETEITKCSKELPKEFLHGDFNAYNILAREKSYKADKQIYSVDGILDFEDMHYGTYVWDIGFMLAHVLLECYGTNSLDAGGHALAGYLSRRNLTDIEMSFLKMCAECRIIQSLVLCAYSSRLDPSNSYVAKCSENDVKYKMLQQLSGISNEELLKKWRKIFSKCIQSENSDL